jgi:hypothetical protein
LLIKNPPKRVFYKCKEQGRSGCIWLVGNSQELLGTTAEIIMLTKYRTMNEAVTPNLPELL